MSRNLTFFFIVVFVLAIDLYVFQGYRFAIKKWFGNYSLWLSIAYWFISLMPILLLLFLGRGQNEHPSTPLEKWVTTFFFIFFIGKLIWAVFFLIDDIWRLAQWGQKTVKRESSSGISRSNFLISLGALIGGGMISTLTYGIVKGAHNYQVVRRKLRIKNLPKAFEGFTIVQLSDIHSGSFWNKEAVKEGVKKIIGLNPDAMFFTGDLVNNKAVEFENFKEIFSAIKPKYGVFSVLGNHDYGDYGGFPNKEGITKEQNLENLKQHQKDMGWDLLLNENRTIEKDGEKIAIIGVENWSAHMNFPKYGKLDEAYKGSEDKAVKLLLSHDPSHWKAQVLPQYPDISAMFSGHTHGMQFGIDTKFYKWSPVQLKYKEWVDLYQEKDQFLYVNRGFGYIGYPGRVGFYPEITLFELESA